METLNKIKERVIHRTFSNFPFVQSLISSLFFFIVLSSMGCSVRDGHYYNHCGGVQVPICEHKVDKAIPSKEEEELKQKILESMTLVLDQVMQNLLMSIK